MRLNRRYFLHASAATIAASVSLFGSREDDLAHATQPSLVKRTPSGVVYTADEHGNSISVIELATGKVRTFPVNISPHNVQIASGRLLLAVGEPVSDGHGHSQASAAHGASEAKGRLLFFDTARMDNGPAASIRVGSHPAHVVADTAGRRAFVTNSDDDALTVIDLARKDVVRTIRTGRYPHGLRMSPDGREIYVANVEDGNVSVVDTAKLTEVARIPVGLAPVQVGFTPDGARVYVSLRDENCVAVIDALSRKKTDTIAVGSGPIQVHATPDGRFVYVANQGTDAAPADTVSVIEVTSGRVVDTIRTGPGAHGVAVSEDGAFVFVTNIVAGSVSVIDASTRAVVANYSVGLGPNGITFGPGGI